jgi:hypothetical protein
MSERRSIRPSTLLGLALGGVLLGHTVTYRLLMPDAHARAVELARSGHGYLAGANAIGVVAAIVALAALFLGRLLRTDGAATWQVAWRLLGFQIAAFSAMEVLERGASGSGFTRLAPVLLVGLPVQAVTAVAIAFVARLLSRAAERVARSPRLPVEPPVQTNIVASVGHVAPAPPTVGTQRGRAPPSFVPV